MHKFTHAAGAYLGRKKVEHLSFQLSQELVRALLYETSIFLKKYLVPQ